jgi:hypothetical protein
VICARLQRFCGFGLVHSGVRAYNLTNRGTPPGPSKGAV